MAWVTFPTLTDGQVLTGAHMQIVRDNFAETAPAKATGTGSFIVTSGTNTVAARSPTNHFVGTAETTAITAYGDLTTVGPTFTNTTGSRAIVAASSDCWNSTAAYSFACFDVSGATTIAATDSRGLGVRVQTGDANGGHRASSVSMVSLTPGSNTFTMRYRVTAGTGRFANREIVIIGL